VLRVGLTGGLSSGKSTVAEMLARRGARVLDADRLVHELMRPGLPVYQEIVRHFGRGILASDKTIDRKKLADAAFGGGRIAELNRIVHPAVIALQDAWMDELEREEPQALAVVEAALILEAGAAPRFDKLVVVTCRQAQKVERFAARYPLGVEAGRAEAARRLAAQMPDKEKVARADYVIDNSGTLAQTDHQVEKVFAELLEIATEAQRQRERPNAKGKMQKVKTQKAKTTRARAKRVVSR
jgi:dephospho-CoA kinase